MGFQSCPLSWWCHPVISSSVVPFSCLWSFPASGSFPMSRLFAPGGQSIGASVSASVLPMNIQGWFPLELTGLISVPSKELSRVFSNTTVQRPSIFQCPAFLIVQISHSYMTSGETIALTIRTFVGKVMSLLFNTLSRFVIVFLPRSQHLLISLRNAVSRILTWAGRPHWILNPMPWPPSHHSSISRYHFLKATAAAKSLQSCPTLCNPIDGSLPGSPVPGIFQARVLE